MDHRLDDLSSRLGELHLARRRLGQSVNASGITLRRALRLTDDARRLTAGGPEPSEGEESWPRAPKVPSRRYPRVAAILVVLVLVLFGVIIQQRRTAVQAARTDIAVETRAPSPSVTAGPRAPTTEPMVIRMHATRRCLVRVVVDGTVLDWRELKEGDEFVLRPAHEILIESSDAEALSATVNGKPIRVEDLQSLFQNSAK